MSVADVTNRCFQAGVGPQKWAGMCHLLKERLGLTEHEFKCAVSNSVLQLFALFPADILLCSYLRTALHTHDTLSLPVLISTFIEASKSANLHDTTTLDMLCRLIQEEHYALGLPCEQTLFSVGDSLSLILQTVNDSLNLLRIVHTLPHSPFHNVVASASQLILLLLSCVGSVSTVSAAEAIVYYAEASDILQSLELSSELKDALGTFTFQLNLSLGEDIKMAQEAQLLQRIQLSMGKGDVIGPNSETDLTTCSLLLRQLVDRRTSPYGSANTQMAVAFLLAVFRWSSWTPKVFYTRLFLSAFSILAQYNLKPKSAAVWRSFIVTRLTGLLSECEQILSSEPVANHDWRGATLFAINSLMIRTDILTLCDPGSKQQGSDGSAMSLSMSHSPFMNLFLQYCIHRTNLVDRSSIPGSPILSSPLATTLGYEAQTSGSEIDVYICSQLLNDAHNEELLMAFVTKACEDIANHPILAEEIRKRFESLCQQSEVEGLSVLCKVMTLHDSAIDIVALHISILHVLANLLAFIESFDCESVGDPQTAVGLFGNVILFVQSMLVKYRLTSQNFNLADHTYSSDYLLSTPSVYRYQADEREIVKVWYKTLFDKSSEGIEDSILRSTKPKLLFKFATTVIIQALSNCSGGRLEPEALQNGISYFTGSLLNWTLVNVIRVLLRDIMEKNYEAAIQLDVLKTLVESSSCPLAVVRLTAHGILSLVSDPRSTLKEPKLREIANNALGLPNDEPMDTDTDKLLALPSGKHWLDQPHDIVRDALHAVSSGKAPALDVARCVSIAGPTRFLRILWDAFDAAAAANATQVTVVLEASRRIATYVLLAPPSTTPPGAPPVPPLLPLFTGTFLHTLLRRLDGCSPAEHTIGIELLGAVIISVLTALLQMEWALRAVSIDLQTEYLYLQPSVSVARKLALDLKKSPSRSAAEVLQRLSSSPSFVANFPMMAA